MREIGFPKEAIEGMTGAVDCRLFFFEHEVGIPAMYLILSGSTVALIILYVLLNRAFFGRAR